MAQKRKIDDVDLNAMSSKYSLSIAQQQRRADMDRYTVKCVNNALFIGVYDGNGSAEVANVLQEQFHERVNNHIEDVNFHDESQMKQAIRRAFAEMDHYINAQFDTTPLPPNPPGSTASIALIREGRCYLAHVGDSPIVYQNMKGLRYESKLHNVANPEEVKRVKSTNIENNRLFGVLEPFRCFGALDLKQKPEHHDGKTGKFVLNAVPDIWTTDDPGWIVVASDGLTQVVRTPWAPKQAPIVINLALNASELLEQALKQPWTNDDITVICAKTGTREEFKRVKIDPDVKAYFDRYEPA